LVFPSEGKGLEVFEIKLTDLVGADLHLNYNVAVDQGFLTRI